MKRPRCHLENAPSLKKWKRGEWTEFQKVCRKGATQRVKTWLLESNPDIHSRTPCGYTPLHCAIKGGVDKSVLCLFLGQGATLNDLTSSGMTPYDVAIHSHQVEWMMTFHSMNAPNGVRHPFNLVFDRMESSHTESVLRCLRDWGVRAPKDSFEWWDALTHNIYSPSIWLLLEEMGVRFLAHDLNGNTWFHQMVRQRFDHLSHIPMVDASVMLTPNHDGETPLSVILAQNHERRRFPRWLSKLIKDQPSILDAKHDGEPVATQWIASSRGAVHSMDRLSHMIAHGWHPNIQLMIPILRDAIEEQNALIVKALMSLGGSALANAPLNSNGCPPLIRATHWLTLRTLGTRRIEPSCYGVWVSLLHGGADQDVTYCGTSMYEMVRHCGMDASITWDSRPFSIQNHSCFIQRVPWALTATDQSTMRHLWSMERLHRLWIALRRIVRVLPFIRRAQRGFKERYYEPRGRFERLAATRFRSSNDPS